MNYDDLVNEHLYESSPFFGLFGPLGRHFIVLSFSFVLVQGILLSLIASWSFDYKIRVSMNMMIFYLF